MAYPGKKSTEYAFVGIPVRIARSYDNGNKNAVNDYVAGLYKDGEIVGAPVRKHQLMIMEGQAVYVVSSTEVSNAVQLTVDRRFHEMLYHIAHGNIEALSKMKDFHAVAHDFVLEYLDKLERFFPILRTVHLTDYKVRVLDSRERTASKVRVLIESTDGQESWTTVGVSADIIEASLNALIDAIEYKLVHSSGRAW